MRSYIQYENFFPAWDHIIKEQLLDERCTEPLSNYRNRSDPTRQLGYGVLGCVLDTMPEYRKAELASAAVILGLAPTMLQLMSASYLDTAMLAYRRPVLASLLSMSSSGVRPLTATEYDDFITKMGTDPFHTNFGRPQSVWAPTIVSMLEYTVASAAVANNAHLAYQLSTLAVCTFSPAEDFLPAAWTAAAVLIHLVGYLAARLKISVKDAEGEKNNRDKLSQRVWAELTPTPWQNRLEVKTNHKHTGWFLVLVSALYIGDALQAFCGTLILSSLVFISVRDSAIIVIRLMASALFARGILIYELAGFRTERDGSDASDKPHYSVVETHVNILNTSEVKFIAQFILMSFIDMKAWQ
ncbi:hypothetical protein FGSG_02404 [Fusarium graminearum PH-1]|uniref:hypothetical protein n=1 Tax=Gibberella zeae (strain ATCC MYA-4620 / CBS 123657 / FGSC 9075 / NRRL 31084 / PH-1) TaxID=229533 RepID=UPI00021F1636|nr:hypothetical protein FGSG_02404 [Fusarium graminearum PH-1]ESU07837.1 hypothetical protein FGSG_02404 [Fusarium graminearum PH-1]|eukprot:XP_011318322.1 hypothetical protein FGSG_02404 [Fusarium graminearum PH-1]